MALASQSPRSNTYRGGTTRNQRKTVISIVVAAGALLGVTALAVLAVAKLGTGTTETSQKPSDPAVPLAAAQPGNTGQPKPVALASVAASEAAPISLRPAAAQGAQDKSTALVAPSAPAKPAVTNPNPSPIAVPGGIQSSTPTPTPTPAPTPTPLSAPTPTPAPAPASTSLPVGTDPASGLPADISELVRTGSSLMAKGDLLGARYALNKALLDGRTPDAEREGLRRQLAALNNTLVFSPVLAQGDALFGSYAVVAGDNITKVMRSQAPFVDRLFLGRINNMADVNKLRVAQRLKVPRQPFHLVVHKDAFRADLYMGGPLPADATMSSAQPIESRLGGWTYIRSFPVGLGESNGTPEGLFGVRPNSKLINPEWINPRDRTRFAPDDPANPIGEHWIGLEGAEERTKTFAAYGIHGTIYPDSIGKSQSMGCVRMLAGDVALVYEVMAEKVSHVWIVK